MKPIRTFTVSPSLPKAIKPLEELAYNLHWAWSHSTIDLFRRLDSELWEKCNHNPVLMLGVIDQKLLESAVEDEGFMSHLNGVYHHYQQYLNGTSSWFSRTYGDEPYTLVGYFSAEFGLTESLSIFAGGLGVLAGDHLKSASDIGVPLVGVGLLYQQGYFHQYLNEAAWQQESYEENDFYTLPLHLERKEDGTPRTIALSFPGRIVFAQIWRAHVGRVSLYLLDTNLEANRPEDKKITYQLYGGDLEMRIKQEILLGIGGFRALETLGLQPSIFHMNEGHSAFLSVELIRWLMKNQALTFKEAREVAAGGLMLTSHTPVPAGHDYFPNDLMNKYFSDFAKELGLPWSDFMALGRRNPRDTNEQFCMTLLALRLANHTNGVSKLHGEVTRQIWKDFWPGVPLQEIPIGHVTNGVHFRSWISAEMNLLYDRYLGPRWQEEPGNRAIWDKASNIAQEELWRTHERRRERLVAFVRQRLRKRLEELGAPKREVEIADEVLDPKALTVGFARRFATYKRATLLLNDRERLARILENAERPVQIIFAGKAHPKDDEGKKLIQQIVNMAGQDRFRRKVVFVQEYDMSVARYLVQGVDLWLNTPRRPMEASGTSGMKAAANGVLNLSVLDGWWDEAYGPSLGWAIGRGEEYDDPSYQDQIEAENIYNLLEKEIIPVFYDRGVDGLPRKWIALMKESISHLCYFFNTNRMVQEYTEAFYVPGSRQYRHFNANRFAEAKTLALWKGRIYDCWQEVKVKSVSAESLSGVKVYETIRVRAVVQLGKLSPADVCVELYTGKLSASGEILNPEITTMGFVEPEKDGNYCFQGVSAPCGRSGRYGFTVRVLPNHTLLATRFLPGLITWAENL